MFSRIFTSQGRRACPLVATQDSCPLQLPLALFASTTPPPPASRVFKGKQVAATLFAGSPKARLGFTCIQGDARVFKGVCSRRMRVMPCLTSNHSLRVTFFWKGKPHLFWGSSDRSLTWSWSKSRKTNFVLLQPPTK